MSFAERLNLLFAAFLRPPNEMGVRVEWSNSALARAVEAMDHFHARAVVRVLADAPFVDPVLVDRLVSTADAHPACDYISYCAGDGRPAIMTHLIQGLVSMAVYQAFVIEDGESANGYRDGCIDMVLAYLRPTETRSSGAGAG